MRRYSFHCNVAIGSAGVGVVQHRKTGNSFSAAKRDYKAFHSVFKALHVEQAADGQTTVAFYIHLIVFC